jgi:YbbR domain-containing protein
MEGRFRKMVLENLGLKIFSVIFAIFLWFMVVGQEKMEVGYIIPVALTGVPDSVVIDGSSLEFIHIRIRGSRTTIQNTSPQHIQATLDLGELKPGEQLIPITSRDIRLPGGVDLVEISPPQILIRAAAKRLVPIKVNITGKPAKGHKIVKKSSIPSNIYVVGPQGEVDTIEEVETFPISIKGASDNLRVRADLVPPSEEVRLLALKPSEVQVVIEETTLEKTLGNIPVSAANGEKASFKPKTVRVVVSGLFSLMQEITAEAIKAEVMIGETRERVFSRLVRISAPGGIRVLEVQPENVEVTLGTP